METNTTTQVKLSTKDRAWALYMELRREDLNSPEKDLAVRAVTLTDNFDQVFYEYYQNKLNQK